MGDVARVVGSGHQEGVPVPERDMLPTVGGDGSGDAGSVSCME